MNHEQTQLLLHHYRPHLLAGAAALFLIIAGVLAFNASRLYVTGTTPENGKEIPSSTTYIELRFNKELAKQDFSQKLTGDTEVFSRVETEGKTMRMHLDRPEISTGRGYVFTWNNLESTDGKVLKRFEYEFTPVYVPFNELSKKEQERLIDDTDVGIDAARDPIYDVIPYATLSYSIEPVITDSPKPKVEVRAILTPREGTSSQAEQYIKQYQKEALEYLSSNGIDVSQYEVVLLP